MSLLRWIKMVLSWSGGLGTTDTARAWENARECNSKGMCFILARWACGLPGNYMHFQSGFVRLALFHDLTATECSQCTQSLTSR